MEVSGDESRSFVNSLKLFHHQLKLFFSAWAMTRPGAGLVARCTAGNQTAIETVFLARRSSADGTALPRTGGFHAMPA